MIHGTVPLLSPLACIALTSPLHNAPDAQHCATAVQVFQHGSVVPVAAVLRQVSSAEALLSVLTDVQALHAYAYAYAQRTRGS